MKHIPFVSVCVTSKKICINWKHSIYVMWAYKICVYNSITFIIILLNHFVFIVFLCILSLDIDINHRHLLLLQRYTTLHYFVGMRLNKKTCVNTLQMAQSNHFSIIFQSIAYRSNQSNSSKLNVRCLHFNLKIKRKK